MEQMTGVFFEGAGRMGGIDKGENQLKACQCNNYKITCNLQDRKERQLQLQKKVILRALTK